ncbi:MAG: transposase [bacterium]
MPRIARIVVPDIPHHVVQRGNYRQDIFHMPDDFHTYLLLLKQYSKRYSLDILGYCLMTNHVHLIVNPRNADSIARSVGICHMRYSQITNRIHNRTGHLWHSRFFSCALDAFHLVAAMRYIEMNPVHARIVRKAWWYQWSSAAVHIGKPDESELLDTKYWLRDFQPDEWKKFLGGREDPEIEPKLMKHLKTGRPLGDDAFVRMIEKKLGRNLRKGAKGRPKKK